MFDVTPKPSAVAFSADRNTLSLLFSRSVLSNSGLYCFGGEIGIVDLRCCLDLFQNLRPLFFFGVQGFVYRIDPVEWSSSTDRINSAAVLEIVSLRASFIL